MVLKTEGGMFDKTTLLPVDSPSPNNNSTYRPYDLLSGVQDEPSILLPFRKWTGSSQQGQRPALNKANDWHIPLDNALSNQIE